MDFQTLPMADAQERFSLSDHLYGARGWAKMLLLPGGTKLSELDLHEQPDDEAYGWIVDGDLAVDGAISCLDESVMALLVTGDLTTGSLRAAGADIAVLGNLTCRRWMVGDYNHGYVHVGGDLTTPWLVVSDHDVSWEGELHGKGVDVFSLPEHASLPLTVNDLLPELLDDDGNRKLDAILEKLRAGETILRS